jgi:hypothetical protein
MAVNNYIQSDGRAPGGVKVHRYHLGRIESGFSQKQKRTKCAERTPLFEPPATRLPSVPEPDGPMWTSTARPTLVSEPAAKARRTDPFAEVANTPSVRTNVVQLRVVARGDDTEDADLVLDGSEFDELLISVERLDPAEAGRRLPPPGQSQVTQKSLESIAMMDQQRTTARSAASAPTILPEQPEAAQQPTSQRKQQTSGAIVDMPQNVAPRIEQPAKVRRFVTNPGGLPLEVMPRVRRLSETMWFITGDQPRMLARHEAEELEINSLERLNYDYMDRRIPESLRTMYSLDD